MLGMHGLPGSGKSTICRYLRDCMFSEFAGKVIYLKLPPNANDEEVSIKSMELLTQLTNFNNKIDLTEVLNFRQVLKITHYYFATIACVSANYCRCASYCVAHAGLPFVEGH